MPSLCHLCLGAPGDKRVPGYKINVCIPCWTRADEGWAEKDEPTLFQALSRQGLLIPDRNARGRLPRKYAPPANYDL